jgi:hypothetical protein
MKIPESIIEKFKLTPSNEQVGQSFIQNLFIYKSELPEFDGIYFMECDFTGSPSTYMHFFNKKMKRDGSITSDFLIDMPIETILKIMS